MSIFEYDKEEEEKKLRRAEYEYGKEEGRKEGIASIILKLYNKGFTEEQIVEVTDKSLEEIQRMIEERNP